MSKILYGFDSDGATNMNMRFEANDYELTDADKVNWTDVPYVNPVNNGRPYFDKDKQQWIEQPIPIEPEKQLLMQLSADNTSLKQMVMAQATQIATLTKGSAE